MTGVHVRDVAYGICIRVENAEAHAIYKTIYRMREWKQECGAFYFMGPAWLRPGLGLALR